MRYRCKRCGDIPEPESHHKMATCSCGGVSVDRGWYGSRVVFESRDILEQLPDDADRKTDPHHGGKIYE